MKRFSGTRSTLLTRPTVLHNKSNSHGHLKWLSRKSRRKRKCSPQGSISSEARSLSSSSLAVRRREPLARWLSAVVVIVMVMAVGQCCCQCTLVRSEALTRSDGEPANRIANYDLNRTDLFTLNHTNSITIGQPLSVNGSTSVNASSTQVVLILRPPVTGPDYTTGQPCSSAALPCLSPSSPSQTPRLTKHPRSISPNGSSSVRSSPPNRNHSVQLININQTDAVKSVRTSVAHTSISASLPVSSAGAVHLLANNNSSSVRPSSRANRVNLSNTTRTQTTLGGIIKLDSSQWSSRTKNSSNNLTERLAKAALPDFALQSHRAQHSHDDSHLCANLSSSATGGGTISANWDCLPNSGNSSTALQTATEGVTRAGDSANKLVPRDNTEVLDRVSVGVSRHEKTSPESITGDSRTRTAVQSSGLDGNTKATLISNSKSESSHVFSHMQDSSLAVSAVIDAPVHPNVLSSPPAPISAPLVHTAAPLTASAAPTASSVLDDPLDTNYYRYSARDNDPNVLLSRYPSLRLPPPPPEFADEFNEGKSHTLDWNAH